MTFEATIKTVYGVERTVVFESIHDAVDALAIRVRGEFLRAGESLVGVRRIA